MKQILLLSDTHSFLDPRLEKHLKKVDQVWHAGDIGELSVCDTIHLHCKTTRIVFGNIDNHQCRAEYPKDQFFNCEGMNVWITHIGGYPPKYRAEISNTIKQKKIDLFICGHSHILKVMYDKNLECLHMNPGAAGKHGFHQLQTALLFSIDNKIVKDLKIIELKKSK